MLNLDKVGCHFDSAFACHQIVEKNALPTLIFMLRSEDVGIHYEAVRAFLTSAISFGLQFSSRCVRLIAL